MGGYLGTPQRTLKKQIGEVRFTIHRIADILNWRDSDVSFAYIFCGSMGCSPGGKTDPAKDTAERGRQKAQIEYHEPEWRDHYDLWAQSLAGLGEFKIDVWDYGDGIADVCVTGTVKKDFYSIALSAIEVDIILKGRLVGAHGTIKLGESCKAWLIKAGRGLRTAERGVNRAMGRRDLFLIADDNDD